MPECDADDPPTRRVRLEGQPTGAQWLGCPCLCPGDPGSAQGPGDATCLLSVLSPFACRRSCIQPILCLQRTQMTPIKVPGICSWLRGPGPLLPDGQSPSPEWPPGSRVTRCAAWPGRVLCTPGRASWEPAGAPRPGLHHGQEGPWSFLPEMHAASLGPVSGLYSSCALPPGSLHVSINPGLEAAAPGSSPASPRCGNKRRAFGSLPFVVCELCVQGQAQAQ